MMSIVIVTTVGSFSFWLLYVYIIYPAFYSPLCRLPAPHWTCHISPLWVLAVRKHRRENKSLHDAHKRLGSVIRVGPNEVSVDGVEGMRVVYQGGFEKGHWYTVFDNYGVPNMFATSSSKPHSLRKRMISNVYSKSYIQSSKASKFQMAHILFTRLIPALNDYSESINRVPPFKGYKDVEVFSLFLATAMDLITAYLFGLSNSTNFIDQESYRRDWQEMYLTRANYPFWMQEVPTLTSFCKQWFPWLRLYPKWVDESNSKLSDWNWGLYDKINKTKSEKEVLNCKGGGAGVDEPVVYNALHTGIDREFTVNGESSILYSTSILQRDRAIASELMDHSLAGQETAGIALTYAAWHISRSPSLQQHLRTEILALKPPLRFDSSFIIRNKIFEQGIVEGQVFERISGSPILPDPRAVDSLPLLHAVVMETLRLHAPIPGPQPRQTPKEGCYIEGCYIPGGVRIASLAYTLHRDIKAFPQPELWKPERWSTHTSSEDKTTDPSQEGIRLREMYKRFWAFGSGGRMCIGSNFAMNEIKFILATIYANFQTTVVDDGGIEQEDAYTARPVGERLVIRFHALRD